MRKRLREELCWTDKLQSPRPRGGGKQRRRLKSSERLAREMEFCDAILNNAKGVCEELKARKALALKKCISESVDLQPLSQTSSDKNLPPVLKQTALPLPEPPGVAYIKYACLLPCTPTPKHQPEDMVEERPNLVAYMEYPSPSQHTQSPKDQLEDVVDEGQNLALRGSFEIQHKPQVELPCPQVAAVEASQVITSFLQKFTQRGIFLRLATTPEFVKNILVGSCGAVTQGTGLRSSMEVMSEEQPGREESKDVQPAKPPCLSFSRDAEVAEDSKEVEPERPSVVGFSRDEVVTKEQEKPCFLGFQIEEDADEPEQVEQESFPSLRFGREVSGELKEAEPEKVTSSRLSREVESEKLPSSKLSREVAEKSKEVEPEKAPSLRFNRNFAEEPNEVEGEEMHHGFDSLVLARGGMIMSESDVEENDGLKDLWDVMELSLACMNETKSSQMNADKVQNDGCIHDFYKKDDMGLVCSKCGLIGQDAEYIFTYVWGEKSSKRHNGNEAMVAKQTTAPAIEDCDKLEDLSVCKQAVEPLVLHPLYQDKLRIHQEEGLRFLKRNLVQDEPSGCILAHAPGTGKSFTVIAFLQSFQNSYPDEKPLIVAPKGMLSVWVREFEKWKVEDTAIFNLQEAKSMEGDDCSHTDALGHQLKRHRQLQMLRQWKAQKSILMVGYSAFSTLMGEKDAAAFPEIKKLLLGVPGILILDEGHFPRNKKAQITQNLSQVHTKRRVLLSGTLFQNNFNELYNLYHLVKPDFMSSNAECTKGLLENSMRVRLSPAKGVFTQSKSPRKKSGREAVELDIFKDLGETIRSGEKERKRQAIGQLRQLSQPFVHWYKGEILEDLPGLIDLTLFLKVTEKQQELLSTLPSKMDWLNKSNKTMRVCIHPLLLNADCEAGHANEIQWNDIEEDPRSSSKIMFILDLLQLAARMKEKVVLFSRYLDPFYLLERMFKKSWGWHLNREILKIEGRTSPEERESTIDRFNEDPKARILFASIKTCGEGISLIGASRIVLLEVQYNPMVSRQAISRAFRIGQRKKVFVYRLVGGNTTEEDAHSKACEKEWLAKQIFEGCDDEDYGKYCHEVDPVDVDHYFESQHLRENVLRCFRYRFA